MKGLDIDPSLDWRWNDSLIRIPRVAHSIIITNPPYLTSYSAKRKGLIAEVGDYFTGTRHDDLYKLALENCLAASSHVVAIIPETFINSSFPKSRLASITVLEESPFDDTEVPVCVACFDGRTKRAAQVRVYKNDTYIGTLAQLERRRLKPRNKLRIRFNAPGGQIALRAVDQVGPGQTIRFMPRAALDYDLRKIGHSSRLVTLIELELDIEDVEALIAECNAILIRYRAETQDFPLSPFKGNRKDGVRRRRLDYTSARAILELAHERITRVARPLNN